ncbi:MAG: hypothetical protein HY794_15130 [Desulfarculus sp.]|nr:hypothetical protein [Desulfarculus sp.]
MLGLAVLLALAPPSQAPAAGPSLAELRTQARFALLDDDYLAALGYLNQALALQPDNHELIQMKVQALRQGQGGEKALEYLRALWAGDAAAFAYLRFEAGYIRVQEKKYDKALVHFRHAEKVDRQRAIREQGQTYLMMKEHEQALAAFRRLDQQSAGTWYLMGQALFLKKEYPAAQEALGKALASHPTPLEAQDINSLLKAVAGAQRAARPWRAYTTVFTQYEDNVFRDPLQSYPGSQPTRQRGDMSYYLRQDLQYELGRQDRLAWGLRGQAQYLGYASLREANYAAWSLGGYLDLEGQGWGLRLPYDFSYYWAQANLSRKVQNNTIAPSFRWQHTPQLRSEAHGLAQHRHYLPSGEPDYWRWRLGLTHFLSRDPRLLPHLRLGYALSQDLASDEASGYYNWEVTLGGAVPLAKGLSLDVSGTYLRYAFDRRVDPYLVGRGTSLVDRRDHQYQAAVQLNYRPAGQWQVVLGYFHTFNDSNVQDDTGFDPYDFKKNTVMLMLVWSF